MTDRNGTSAAGLRSRYRQPIVVCGGAEIRAHSRQLATVVTIQGEISADNAERVTDYARRFILADGPLVLDLAGVSSFAAGSVSLLHVVGWACRAAGMQWAVIASPAVAEQLRAEDEAVLPIASSVDDALHYFADAIHRRRQLLLPLIRKTA